MSHPRFSLHTVVLALALAALLAAGLTLVVVAQDPDDHDTATAQEPEVRAPSPDQATVTEEPELLLDPSSPSATAYFKSLAASTFVPSDEDMTFDYYGSGCVYRTGGEITAVHSLELPQGAAIRYLRLYFFDKDDLWDARATIFAFDGEGNTTEIAYAVSSGTPGQGSALSNQFYYVVDNYAEALVVRLNYGYAGDSGLRICGVRVMYEYTPSIVDLPLILNGAGP